MQPGLIIVSNRLPISVKKVDGKLEFSRSIGGLATGLDSYTADSKNKWIGWPGLASDNLTEQDRQKIADELRKTNCYPVFLTKKQIDGFYNGYSNRLIWPLLHDIPVTKSALTHEEEYWKVFRQVSEIFSATVLAMSNPSDTIWVHDYLLMLLPALLRAERPDARIGFFLHTTFPAPKGFDQIKHGLELIRGVLGSDLIGFQIKRYIDNFMATIEYFKLGQIEPQKIILSDRAIRVTDFPIGIDYNKWKQAYRLQKVRQESRRLRLKYRGLKIIGTVERQDLTKGLPKRVEAYRELLRQNRKLHGKIKLVMIGAPTRADVQEYQKLKQQLEELVADVNKEFGTSTWQPVDYQYRTLPFEHVAALFRRADVGYIAPFRDGMNLMAKEYVASKQGLRTGVLVLSDTAGAAQELTEAVIVDALDTQSHVKGLEQALNMSRWQSRRRIRAMQHTLATSTIHTWAGGFMRTLQRSTGLNAVSVTRTLTPDKEKKLLAEYAKAFRPLLLIDYDGVLTPFTAKPDDAKPSAELKKLLKKLATTAGSNVVIISGRPQATLDTWLGDLGLHFAAEHGAYTRKSTSKGWQTTTDEASTDWQKKILPILEKYAARTPGSFVEQKKSALVWHYRQAKPYYAHKNLVILNRILKPLAKSLGLRVRQGHMILEIKPADVNKGNIVKEWLATKPDFVLTLGDDYTDEDMFAATPASAYSIKVGPGRTNARYRIKNVDAVLKLLEKISKT